ncbi:MAG TPA: OmpA family protein [Verrucomicrobiae bacterium]
MNQIVFPLALALAATMATTGCKKGQPRTTPLPGSRATDVSDNNNSSTLPPGNPIEPGTGPGTTATTGLDEFEGMTKDPAALAADTVHFAFDSAAIKKSEDANISAVASALSANANDKLLIEGNCDERGTEEYNRSLGERRALAAREALAKAGVSPDRIRTISYGKDKPADPGHGEAAWKANRNDTFILLHPKTTM